MAADLINRSTAAWKPESYRDTYRDRLLDVIKAKGKGKEVRVEETPEPRRPGPRRSTRASVEAAKARAARQARRGRAAPPRSGTAAPRGFAPVRRDSRFI